VSCITVMEVDTAIVAASHSVGSTSQQRLCIKLIVMPTIADKKCPKRSSHKNRKQTTNNNNKQQQQTTTTNNNNNQQQQTKDLSDNSKVEPMGSQDKLMFCFEACRDLKIKP